MPGTIQVSVLDMDLPSSCSFSSSISVKVSMGKREYQSMGKADFSFPLTTLRDNLVLTLLDGDGNELSQTGVETMSIVEKEIWDDLFPLEGGGHLHIKLQFILSDEERKRVREMRESAMKKKHEGLCSSHRQLENFAAPDATVGVNIASPASSVKHEVADGSEANPSQGPLSQEFNILDHRMHLNGKIKIHLPPTEVPVRPIASLEDINSELGCSGTSDMETDQLASGVKRKDQTHTPEQPTLKRSLSSVRSLISAFESSLAQEEGADGSEPTPTSHSRETALKYPLKPGKAPLEKEILREKTKLMQQISSKHLNSLSKARFGEVKQQSPNYLTTHGGEIGLDAETADGASGNLVLFSSDNTPTDQTKSSGISKFRRAGESEYRHEKSVSSEDFTRSSITEIATVSGRMLDHPLASNKPCVCTNQQDLSLGFDLADNRCRICRENSDEIIVFGGSNMWNKPVAHSEVEWPGCWILSDGSRRLCITTGSKQVMELMGSWGVCRETHQREMSLFKMDAFDEHNIHDDCSSLVNKVDATPQCSRKVNPEGSADVSGGLIGQVIKVAIMVAFGTLVLVTRERKSRSLL